MKTRNYGIDLLRIISMLMIVVGHVCYQGGIINASGNNNFFWLIEILCFCAVNCYGLISGYVGIKTEKSKRNRFIELWLRTIFYCLAITFITSIVSPSSVSKRDWLSAVTPILSGEYWYFTAYFVVVLFSPIINYAINKMNKQKIGAAILSLIICFTILPLLKGVDAFKMTYGYSGWWLLVLYLIGGFCAKYNMLKRIGKRLSLVVYFASSLLAWLLAVVLKIGANSSNPFGSVNAVTYYSVLMLFAAVGLLSLFEKMNFAKGSIKIISFLSPHAFSVYLIHANPLVIRCCIEGSFVWVLNFSLPIAAIFIVLFSTLIYMVCTIIDIPVGLFFLKTKIGERIPVVEKKIGSFINGVLTK